MSQKITWTPTIYFLLHLALLLCLILEVVGDRTLYYGHEEGANNLLENFGFEEDSTEPWEIVSSEYVITTDDAHTGTKSLKLNSRSNRFAGPKQKVYNVTGNATYYASCFLKVLSNSPDSMYFSMSMWIGYQETGGEYVRFRIAQFPKTRASARWRQLGGDFRTPDKDITYLEIFFENRDYTPRYMMDSLSLVHIPDNPHWRETTDRDIRAYRMNNLTVRATFPKDVPYCKMQIKVNLTRLHFGFGTVVGADRFIENSDFGRRYRQFHFDHFTWGGFANAMKWRPMEPREGDPNFARVDKALDYFEEYNITMRGHSILWGVQKNNPDYVKNLNGSNLRAQVNRRIKYVVPHYKGRLYEWDTVNEWLHGTFYDEMIGDPLIQDKVYNKSRELDPDVKLFLNDYQVLRLGDYTSALVDIAQELLYRGAPVDGIGMQSHLKVPVPPEILKKRIEILEASGFTLTITELSIHTTDIPERAERLEVALRTYFANPAVQAIVFWMVSDQHRASFEPEETALFEGENFTPNAAGQVFLDLTKKWQTHVNIPVTSRKVSKKFDAFHGAYNAEVLYNGESIKNETFYLHPGGDLVIDLDLDKSDFVVDPAHFVECGDTGPDRPTKPPRAGKGWERLQKTYKYGKVQLGNSKMGSEWNSSKRVSEA